MFERTKFGKQPEIRREAKGIEEITLESIQEAPPLEREERLYLITMLLYEKGLKHPDIYVRLRTAQSLGALVPVNPELASALYKKGLEDPHWGVRLGIAQSLGALAPVNPELFVSLYEKGLKDPDLEIREGTARSLGALVPVNPELASALYKKGLEDPDWGIRLGIAQSLGALAPVNPELASALYKKGLEDPKWEIREGTAQSLGALAPVNPELASALYKKGLEDPHWGVRLGIAQSLGALAPVNPELFVSLYEKGLKDPDWRVCRETAQSLGALVPVNPELASALYKKGLEDPDWGIRLGIAQSLGALAPVNPELASALYKKGLEDPDWRVRLGIAQSLGALAPVNPELFVSLYEKGLKDPDWRVRRPTAQSLGALAPVNPELFVSLYEKGLETPDAQVREETARSLKELALSLIKTSAKNVITPDNLKRLIKTYGFSSKKEDIEFLRNTIHFFKKELPPFLESKNLPESLKYQLMIELIEYLSKEELLNYFKKAVLDFNSLSKKEDLESKRAMRLILEFLSLLPLSESSHFLATKVERLIPKLGDLNSLEMRTLKALADTNTREANRLLLSILYQESLALRRREYIFRKLVQNKVLEEGLLEYLGKTRETKEAFFRALNEFREYFPGVIPNKDLFDLHFKNGLSLSEIKEMRAEFEREDLPFSEIVSRLSGNRKLALVYFTLCQPPHRYSNVLSFEKFFYLIKKAADLEDHNQELKAELSSLWLKKGKSPQEIAQFLHLIEKGVPIFEEVIRSKEEEEKEELKEISLRTIENLIKNLINLEPIFAIAGRLQGLVSKDEQRLKEIQEMIAQAAEYLDPFSPAIFKKENLAPLYKQLYLKYQEILKERGEEIPSEEELYQHDLEKVIEFFQRGNVLTSELLLNRQKNLREISDFIRDIILKRLEGYSKKYGPISEKLQILIDYLKEEIKTRLGNLQLKIETKPLRITFKHVPKYDFKEQKHLIEFMRIGDARETCIATNGSGFWTIPLYLRDLATIGFLILDQDKAIGHIVAHLGKDNQGNLVLLVNGIHIERNYPIKAIAQRAASYLENFAKQTGLNEVLFAFSRYTDVEPPDYHQTSRIVQRFQGVKGMLYSEFGASTEYLESVTCYEKKK
jgi:HEAT repeat protein